MPAVIWFHGKDSEPWGHKSLRLAELARSRGLAMEAPDHTDTKDPEERAARALVLVRGMDEPPILVGSSLGGYLSACVARQLPCRGLFLLAPAVFVARVEESVFKRQDFSGISAPCRVVHGWRDELIPADNVIRFARPISARLTLVDDGHRLHDSMPLIERLFELFLDEMLAG